MKIKIVNNSGIALISSVFIALFLSILAGAAFMSSQMQLSMVEQKRSVQEAFYAAESGIERSVFELRRNPAWVPGQDGFAAIENARLNTVAGDDNSTIGFYSVKVVDGGFVSNLGQSRWVQSIGRDAFNHLTRVIVARILVDDLTRFIVSTPGNLKVKSGASIDADILGQNISFNINQSIIDDAARGITVNGDILYINQINPNDPNADPDITISGDIINYPSITFPGIDTAFYTQLAQDLSPLEGYHAQGNLNVDLSRLDQLNSDPNFKPLIIYADGNITLHGEFPHSLVVVAGGNINIIGDILPDTSFGLPQMPQIGLFAKKDVIIPDGAVNSGGDLSVEAFVMADGGGESDGVFSAQSSSTLGTFNFNGSIFVRAKSEEVSAIDLNIFEQRNYTHNPNLNVPFTPYIANIIEWKEANISDPFPPEE